MHSRVSPPPGKFAPGRTGPAVITGRRLGRPRPPPPRGGTRAIETKSKALAIAEAAQSKKGQNITIIDLEGESSYTDFLVIVSAYSERQTRAIADAIAEDLKGLHGERALTREGDASWILIDFGDVVAHVFHEDTRAYYDLERLWGKSPRVPIPPPLEATGSAAG